MRYKMLSVSLCLEGNEIIEAFIEADKVNLCLDISD